MPSPSQLEVLSGSHWAFDSGTVLMAFSLPLSYGIFFLSLSLTYTHTLTLTLSFTDTLTETHSHLCISYLRKGYISYYFQDAASTEKRLKLRQLPVISHSTELVFSSASFCFY